jgi:hypothetical protein
MTYGQIIGIVISGIIILISGILILFLFLKRKQFPYIHFNSFWERVVLSLVCLSQIYCLIYHIIDSNMFYVFKGIKILIVDVLICISIIARAYNINCLIYNNYLIISQNFYEIVNYIKKENGEMIFTQNYRKNFIHLKFFTILGLFFIIIPFSSIKNFTLIFYFFYEKNEQSIKAFYFSIYYSHIIYLLILSSLSIIYSLIKKYPINQDKFYCISEIKHLIRIIFVSSSIKTFIIVIFIQNSGFLGKDISLFIDSIFNCFILILYSTLTIIRNKNFTEKNSLLNIEDIDIFLSTEIRFKIFQNYISKKHEKSLKLLKFYADYYNYHQIVYKSKQKIKSLYNEKMHERTYSDEIILEKNEEEIIDSNEEKIREKAKQIYLDYFSNVNISNSNDKEFNSIIEFPIDIYEKVQESYNANFTGIQNDKIFNEAFGWIKEKLMYIFNEYSSSSDEMEKMKKILFFIDCFEANENENKNDEF